MNCLVYGRVSEKSVINSLLRPIELPPHSHSNPRSYWHHYHYDDVRLFNRLCQVIQEYLFVRNSESYTQITMEVVCSTTPRSPNGVAD